MAEKQVTSNVKPAANAAVSTTNGNGGTTGGNETVHVLNYDTVHVDWDWNVRSKSDLGEPSDAVRDTTEKKASSAQGASLKEFIDTFRFGGQDTACVVRPVKNGVSIGGKKTDLKLELICGFRRLGAIQQANTGDLAAESAKEGRTNVAGLPNGHFKAVIRELSDRAARILNIRENTLRNNLKTPDILKQVRNLDLDGMTQVEIGQSIGITQSFVSKLIGIARLPKPVLDHWRDGTLLEGLKADKTYNRLPTPELTALSKLAKEQNLPEKEVIERYVLTLEPPKGERGAEKGKKSAERIAEFAKQIAKLVSFGFILPGNMHWHKLVGPGKNGFMVDAGSKDHAKVMEMCSYAEKVYARELRVLAGEIVEPLESDADEDLLDDTDVE
jgi:ParB-like chromosome segregation protein Spo0J